MEGEIVNKNYTYPDYYNWPFFFTIQKNAETRLKQFTMWSKLLCEFCQANKIWRLSKSQFGNSLGQNIKINRFKVIFKIKENLQEIQLTEYSNISFKINTEFL